MKRFTLSIIVILLVNFGFSQLYDNQSVVQARERIEKRRRIQEVKETNFQSEQDVFNYLEGKTFSNSDGNIKVRIGYSSSINSYGIMLNGNTTHFNLDIIILSTTSAIVIGQSLSDPNGKLKLRIQALTNCIENSGSYYCLTE